MDERPFSQTSIAAEVTGGEGAQPPLLRGYTCLSCGHRSATWAAFRAHRRECPNRPRPPGRGRNGGADPAPDPEPALPGEPAEQAEPAEPDA